MLAVLAALAGHGRCLVPAARPLGESLAAQWLFFLDSSGPLGGLPFAASAAADEITAAHRPRWLLQTLSKDLEGAGELFVARLPAKVPKDPHSSVAVKKPSKGSRPGVRAERRRPPLPLGQGLLLLVLARQERQERTERRS